MIKLNKSNGGHTHVHGSTLHGSQEVEATQVFMDGRTDKQNVVYTNNDILFSLKKKGNPVTYYSMSEP